MNHKKRYDEKLRQDARTFDSLDKQFKKHDVRTENAYQAHFTEKGILDTTGLDPHAVQAMLPNSKVLGMNELGRPTAYFVYGNDRTTEREFEADLDLHKQMVGNDEVLKCVGMQLLCPKCGAPLYVKGEGLDGGHEIIIHWDKMVQSNVDRKYRPIVTVVGDFGCDYSDAEITGVKKSRASHVIMRCNWRGGIIEGRCFDHTPKVIGVTG